MALIGGGRPGRFCPLCNQMVNERGGGASAVGEGVTRRQVLGWMVAVPAAVVGTHHRPWHKPQPSPSPGPSPPPLSPQPTVDGLNAVPGRMQPGGVWPGGAV